MTTLKTVLLASLVSAAALSTSAYAWGEPAGSEVDRINGAISSISIEPGYPVAPSYDYRPERPYSIERPEYPRPYDRDYDIERREFSMHSRRIDARQHDQASRIESAYREGRLGTQDYYALKNEQNDIHRIEASMKADQRLSRREREYLNALLDRASDHIRAISIPRPRPYEY